MFKGIIIEESLADASVLKDVRIVETDISQVTEKHKTPWVTQWTLHEVEIDESQIDLVATRISTALDPAHASSWYADFKDERMHYIVFRDKVFKIDRSKKEEYVVAVTYGASIGIPAHQLDFTE